MTPGLTWTLHSESTERPALGPALLPPGPTPSPLAHAAHSLSLGSPRCAGQGAALTWGHLPDQAVREMSGQGHGVCDAPSRTSPKEITASPTTAQAFVSAHGHASIQLQVPALAPQDAGAGTPPPGGLVGAPPSLKQDSPWHSCTKHVLPTASPIILLKGSRWASFPDKTQLLHPFSLPHLPHRRCSAPISPNLQ